MMIDHASSVTSHLLREGHTNGDRSVLQQRGVAFLVALPSPVNKQALPNLPTSRKDVLCTGAH